MKSAKENRIILMDAESKLIEKQWHEIDQAISTAVGMGRYEVLVLFDDRLYPVNRDGLLLLGYKVKPNTTKSSITISWSEE